MREDDRERADFFLRQRLCWYSALFEFCGSFRDLAHESCIKGANHERGVSKSTLVVDKDSVHTHTQHAFSLMVLTHLLSLIIDAHAPQRAQENDSRHIVTHSHSISSHRKKEEKRRRGGGGEKRKT